jgi:hypothetical protein
MQDQSHCPTVHGSAMSFGITLGVFVALATMNIASLRAQTTIVARETGSWLVHEDGLEELRPQWEITYEVTENTVTRTKLVDIRDGSIRIDNTVYRILPLPTQDMAALILNSVPEAQATQVGPVIRALGQPAPLAVEILVIGPSFVRSTRSSAGYFAITDLERSR